MPVTSIRPWSDNAAQRGGPPGGILPARARATPLPPDPVAPSGKRLLIEADRIALGLPVAGSQPKKARKRAKKEAGVCAYKGKGRGGPGGRTSGSAAVFKFNFSQVDGVVNVGISPEIDRQI